MLYRVQLQNKVVERIFSPKRKGEGEREKKDYCRKENNALLEKR
jgi:hypothetical protein